MPKDKNKKRPSSRRNEPQGPPKRAQVGTIQKSKKGFAFVISKQSDQEDIFIPPQQALGLFQGDEVQYIARSDGRKSFAQILGITKRKIKKVMGKTFHDGQKFLMASMEDDFVIPNPPQALRKDQSVYVIGKILKYPTQEHFGEVEVDQILGAELTPSQDIPIAIEQFGLKSEFSQRAMKEVSGCEKKHQQAIEHLGRRKDFRTLPFVTIDGSDAKDFDDAICVVVPPSGKASYVLYVSIADVSFFIHPGSELDHEAYDRATSVYFPGTCLPMLPEALSNDLCSLRPQQPRLTMTAEIHFDKHGAVLESHFYESLIQTHARLTYHQVEKFLLENKIPTGLKASDSYWKMLKTAYSLFQVLLDQRKQRGVLEFDLPETRYELDQEGMPENLFVMERLESHKLIEEFMIAANRSVAKALRKGRQGGVYRIHEPPDEKALEDLGPLFQSFQLTASARAFDPQNLSDLIAKTQNHPGRPILHKMILRAQKQAVYSPEPKGHFGLALQDYTHFTSPIRRYPDLMVHRLLKQLIRSDASDDKMRGSLEEMTTHCSQMERRAIEAERYVGKRKQCWFAMELGDQMLQAVVNWPSAKGIFLEIPEYCIEGFLPLTALDGFYEYDRKNFCLRKRPGKGLIEVGDSFEVRIKDVNLDAGEIEFELEHPPQTQRPVKKRVNQHSGPKKKTKHKGAHPKSKKSTRSNPSGPKKGSKKKRSSKILTSSHRKTKKR